MPDTEFKDATDGTSGAVNRVAVRLAPFWPEDPDLWFAQVEAQFETAGIKTDATKFSTVIQQLDSTVAREVRDIILTPPTDGKYEKLKQELIKRLSISREQRLRQLLMCEEMGDRKPTQFLRHLRQLGGDGVTDQFLRTLWTNRLPPHIQSIIVSRPSSDLLDDVAELADKIYEVTPSSHQVARVSTSNTFEGMLQKLEDNLSLRIQNEISQQIAQLNIGRSRDRYQGSRSRSNSRRRRSTSRTPGVCWYHDTFGEKARKCNSPCNYTSGNGRGGQ